TCSGVWTPPSHCITRSSATDAMAVSRSSARTGRRWRRVVTSSIGVVMVPAGSVGPRHQTVENAPPPIHLVGGAGVSYATDPVCERCVRERRVESDPHQRTRFELPSHSLIGVDGEKRCEKRRSRLGSDLVATKKGLQPFGVTLVRIERADAILFDARTKGADVDRSLALHLEHDGLLDDGVLGMASLSRIVDHAKQVIRFANDLWFGGQLGVGSGRNACMPLFE